MWQPYGGEEAGSGLADVLFGTVNPSARLPQTFYTQAWADTMNNNVTTSYLAFDLEVGVGRTHRYVADTYAANDTYVKHRFGYGLSYTRFEYSGLTVSHSGGTVSVRAMVKNTGDVDGAEVVQVYLSGAPGLPNLVTPRHNLVAFKKIDIAAGATAAAEFAVPAEQLQTAMEDGTRRVVPGMYTVSVGGHQPADPEGDAGSSGECVSDTVQL